MIKTSMTLAGKIFMILFFFSLGLGVGIYISQPDEIEDNTGNKTEIVIEKNKDGQIIIETESKQGEEVDNDDDEPKKKKKFWLF
ncbi:hypothetical protein [Carboxylicivirga sp. RSCT41]|uniref:hypothetical protein n=1 Tax=Carboxylicivirga agarovorans TaxID=3417570 RepID=UPI003D33D330